MGLTHRHLDPWLYLGTTSSAGGKILHVDFVMRIAVLIETISTTRALVSRSDPFGV